MLQRPTRFKMSFPTLAVALVVAVVASAAFAGAASAATQHWYVGSSKLKAPAPVTGVGTGTFTYGWAIAGAKEDYECHEMKFAGSIDPAGSISPGRIQLEKCIKVGFPKCEVGTSGSYGTFSGSIGESLLGTAISYGTPNEGFFEHLNNRGYCGGAFSNEYFLMYGTAVSVSVPKSPGEFEFSKNSGSSLHVGGQTGYFTGRYSLTSAGKPVTIAP
jgi:hypothetical protein